MCIMFAFVISYVQTVCEYIQSTHWLVPGYCLGQMWTKAILWMKSSIASPTPRGVPVSLLRSWSSITCIINVSATQINHQVSLWCLMSCKIFRAMSLHHCDIPTTVLFLRVSSKPPHLLCHIRLYV